MAAAEQPLNSCHDACHLPHRLWPRSSLSEPTRAQVQLWVRNLANRSLYPRIYFVFWGKCKAESEDPLAWYTISNNTEKRLSHQHQRMWSLRPWSHYSIPCPPETQSLRRVPNHFQPQCTNPTLLALSPCLHSLGWEHIPLWPLSSHLLSPAWNVSLASPSLFFRSQASQRTLYCSSYLL